MLKNLVPNACVLTYDVDFYTIDRLNKYCVDCNEYLPKIISLNNGVFICEKCAEEHKKLGNSISYLKNIHDKFDTYLIKYAQFGGNSKFKSFCSHNDIDTNLPIEKKYKTVGVNFYRKNLKLIVFNQKILIRDFLDPNIILENIENNFPEFDNYVLSQKIDLKSNILNDKNNFVDQHFPKFAKNFLNSMKKFGKSFMGFTKEKGEKFNNSQMGLSIKNSGDYILQKTDAPLKNLGKKVNDLNQSLEPYSNNIKNGMYKFTEFTTEKYYQVKNKIINNEDNKDNNNINQYDNYNVTEKEMISFKNNNNIEDINEDKKE